MFSYRNQGYPRVLCCKCLALGLAGVLHSAQHQGAVLSGSTPNSYFVSIDAIKMGMMGKACQFPGAIAMICNLCVSVGQGQEQIYSVRRHWLSGESRSESLKSGR